MEKINKILIICIVSILCFSYINVDLSNAFILNEDNSINSLVLSDLLDSSDSDKEISLSYSFKKPEITQKDINGRTFSKIFIEDLSNFEKSGLPSLPVKGIKVLIPAGFSVEDISVQTYGKTIVELDKKVIPGQMPVPILPEDELSDYYSGIYSFESSDKPNDIELKKQVYSSNELYPGYLYDFPGGGYQVKRGYNILYLNLYPVQYNPLVDELECYDGFEVTVKMVMSDFESINFRDSVSDRDFIKDIVENPDEIGSYEDVDVFNSNSGESVDDSDVGLLGDIGLEYYPYVIITSQSLASYSGDNSFYDLCDYRTNHGLPGTIVTVEDINNDYSGVDTEEKIRNFIKYAYNNWDTEYVLLGGDYDIIPARKLYASTFYDGCDAETPGKITNLPSDLYYSCLDGSFNSDGDDKWGEPCDGMDFSHNGWDVDLSAEVYVGRASVGKISEIKNFVKKTLDYENSEDDYLSKALWAGEYIGFGGIATFAAYMKDQNIGECYDDGYVTSGLPENIFEYYSENLSHVYKNGYTVDRLYQLYTNTRNWGTQDIISRLNDGVHLINHLGHSNWFINMNIRNNNISQLNNNKYCFIYSQGCNAGAFDDITDTECGIDNPNHEDCIAEYLTVKSSNGAFAGIWNTRYGFGFRDSTDGPSNRFDREFWDAVFNEGICEIGRANQDSKEDNLYRIDEPTMRWITYGLTLFGDPAVKLKPPSPSLSASINLKSQAGTKIQEINNIDFGILTNDEIKTINFDIWNNAYRGTLNFSIINENDWFSITPTIGNSIGPNDKVNIEITVDATALMNGTHEGDLKILSNIVNRTIKVRVMKGAVLEIKRTTAVQEHGLVEGETKITSLTINNPGYGILSYSISENSDWLTLSQNSGTCKGFLEDWTDIDETFDEITITLDSTGLSTGVYTTDLILNSNGGNKIITHCLFVNEKLSYSPDNIDFGEINLAEENTMRINVWNFVNNYPMSYSISSDCEWLKLDSYGGTSSGERDIINLRIDSECITGLGSYKNTINIDAGDAGQGQIIVRFNASFASVSGEEAFSRGACHPEPDAPSDGDDSDGDSDHEPGPPVPPHTSSSSDPFNWNVVWNCNEENRGLNPWDDYVYYKFESWKNDEDKSRVWNISRRHIDHGMSVGQGIWLNYHFRPMVWEYFIYRSFLVFDTENLADNINILDADLELLRYASYDILGEDFDILIQHDPNSSYPQMEPEDFNKDHYDDNGGSINTAEIRKPNVPIKIQLNSIGKNWIDKDDSTRLCLRSDKDIHNNLESYYDNEDNWFSPPEGANSDYPDLVPPGDLIYFCTSNGTKYFREKIGLKIPDYPRLVLKYGDAPVVSDFSPVNGCVIDGLSSVLSVDVSDVDGNSLCVSFYDAEKNTIIGSVDGLASSETASVVWSDLKEDAEYSWYAVVSDGLSETRSDTHSFYTDEAGFNSPPVVSNENPLNNSADVDVSLSEIWVDISDVDGDVLDWSIESSPDVGSEYGTCSNDTVSCVIDGSLDYDTIYTWYVNVSDGEFENMSDVFSFVTIDEPIVAPSVEIVSPTNGFYLFGNFVSDMYTPFVIGGIDIVVEVDNPSDFDVDNVSFMVDGSLLKCFEYDSSEDSYSYFFDEKLISLASFSVVVSYDSGIKVSDEVDVFVINFGLL